MNYVIENWGSFIGVLGLVASVGGLVYAFLARRAAKSAEQAASEAHRAITRRLSSVGVERAVALINRLKDLHRQGNWESALWLYQDLRTMLNEIRAGTPEHFAQYRDFLRSAVPEITAMERLVERSQYENENREPEDIPSLNQKLSEIQETLETLQSSIMYTDETASN